MTSQLHNRIMSRIYRIYVLRRLLSGAAVKLYAAAVSVFGIMALVSVGNVIANMPSFTNMPAWFDFLISAVTNTTFVVQVFLAIFAFAIVAFMRDLIAPSRPLALRRA